MSRKRTDTSRDAGGFAAIPWQVLDSASYIGLSHPAKALLMELARQYKRDNNGRLLLSRAYLAARGWKSADVIHRATAELMAAGFLHQTVQGHRPNKASWFAVTWLSIDRLPGYDQGALETFERGAYRKNTPLKITPLSPGDGLVRGSIGPGDGLGSPCAGPGDGPIKGHINTSQCPGDGHHLDKPSPARQTARTGNQPSNTAHTH